MAHDLIVNLLEVPIDDGEFRTKNLPGEKFRPILIDRGDQLLTKVCIVGITHGELAESSGFGTILIFEIQFVATGGRRFKSGSVTLKFDDADGQMSRDPVVHAISPSGRWALHRIEKVQNVKYGINAGITAGIEPVRVETGILWELEEVKRREFYTALTGVTRVMRTSFTGEENVVIWTLEENKDKADGIPTFMRAAVLLRRPYKVPFSFTVKVKADVDFIGEVKTLFGLEKKDPIDPVEIDPKSIRKAHTVVKALDPTSHNLKEMDNLDLTGVAGVKVITVTDEGGSRKGGASK